MGNQLDDLKVVYGEKTIYLNPTLLDRQKKWDNIKLIKSLHTERMMIEASMEVVESIERLQSLGDRWTENQYKLQEAWGFKRDANYHKSWTVPRCTCPKIDNEDAYPFQMYVSDNCPVHKCKLK